MAGPLAGLFASFVLLYNGLELTAFMDLASREQLPSIPVEILRISALGGNVAISSIVCVIHAPYNYCVEGKEGPGKVRFSPHKWLGKTETKGVGPLHHPPHILSVAVGPTTQHHQFAYRLLLIVHLSRLFDIHYFQLPLCTSVMTAGCGNARVSCVCVFRPQTCPFQRRS